MGECKQCKGRLEEDFISDYLTMSVDQRPCALCRGTGVISTGPYRLADGTWSDGVDRSKRIWSTYFAMTNNGRWHVYKGFADFFTGHEWRVYSDRGFLSYHKTHAEAIAYADKHPRMARTNQGENNE